MVGVDGNQDCYKVIERRNQLEYLGGKIGRDLVMSLNQSRQLTLEGPASEQHDSDPGDHVNQNF